MKKNFEKAMKFVFIWEGEWTGKSDPGGRTRWGISEKANPDVNLDTLTKERAKRIYKERYWDRMNCDGLKSGIDIFIFDTAVNMGRSFADKMLLIAYHHSLNEAFFARMMMVCKSALKVVVKYAFFQEG